MALPIRAPLSGVFQGAPLAPLFAVLRGRVLPRVSAGARGALPVLRLVRVGVARRRHPVCRCRAFAMRASPGVSQDASASVMVLRCARLPDVCLRRNCGALCAVRCSHPRTGVFHDSLPRFLPSLAVSSRSFLWRCGRAERRAASTATPRRAPTPRRRSICSPVPPTANAFVSNHIRKKSQPRRGRPRSRTVVLEVD